MTHHLSVRSGVLLTLAAATFAITGCSKDKKDEAVDAAAAVTVDAAVVATVDAAVADAAVIDAAVAPLATATTTAVPAKPKAAAPADPPICVSARTAKEHKSPAAPSLERQCIAAGGKL